MAWRRQSVRSRSAPLLESPFTLFTAVGRVFCCPACCRVGRPVGEELPPTPATDPLAAHRFLEDHERLTDQRMVVVLRVRRHGSAEPPHPTNVSYGLIRRAYQPALSVPSALKYLLSAMMFTPFDASKMVSPLYVPLGTFDAGAAGDASRTE